MTKKVLVYILLTAFLLTVLSVFYIAEYSIFQHRLFRGFPFQFIIKTPVQKYSMSFPLVLMNIFFYFILISAFWYLLKVDLKNRYGLYASWAVLLTTLVLFLGVVTGTSCTVGFPMEFYEKCMTDGNIMDTQFLGFNVLFWLVLFYIVFYLSDRAKLPALLKRITLYKDFFWTTVGIWTIFFLVSILGLMFSDSETHETVVYSMITVFGLVFFTKIKSFYRKSNIGIKIFLNKAGYFVLGLGLGFGGVSTIFNLFYRSGGWFDFTDFGFYLLASPLLFIFKFEPDSDVLIERALLYLLTILSVIIISYLVDMVFYAFGRLVVFCRKKFIK